MRGFMRKVRAKLKRKKKQKKEALIERQVRSGNLNFGLPPEIGSFPSWEDYKVLREKLFEHEIKGDEARKLYKTYLKEKEEFLESRRKLMKEYQKDPTYKILTNVPMIGEDCRNFRLAHMEVITGIDRILAIQNHTTCKPCQFWFMINKKRGNIGKVTGVDLWHPERNTSAKHYSDEELQAIAEEEWRKMGLKR